MGYEKQMQTLITKTSVNIIFILSLCGIVICLIWLVPTLQYRKHKKKKHERKTRLQSLLAQIAITVISLLFSLTTVSSFQDINNMKRDIQDQSFITYVGNYHIDDGYYFSSSITDLWLDLCAVTIEAEADTLWFDILSDTNIDLSGTGTIVYGKNSKYIVSIESNE